MKLLNSGLSVAFPNVTFPYLPNAMYKTKQNIDKYNFDEETKKKFNYQIEALQNCLDKKENIDISTLKDVLNTFNEKTGEYYTQFYQTINKTNANPYTQEEDDGFEFYNKF